MLLGSDMLTQDLDVCVNSTPENWLKIYEALVDFQPKHRMIKGLPALTKELIESKQLNNLYLTTNLGILDCIERVTGIGNYEEVMRYSKPLKFSDFSVNCLQLEGLILSKSALNREKDRQTVLKLKAIQEKLKGE